MLILYISGGIYSLKSTPNDRLFLRNFSWQFLFTLRIFARNLLRGNRRRNTFRISIWCLAWDSNPGFSSNKPTHYLLDHGDFNSSAISGFIPENHVFLCYTRLSWYIIDWLVDRTVHCTQNSFFRRTIRMWNYYSLRAVVITFGVLRNENGIKNRKIITGIGKWYKNNTLCLVITILNLK